MRILVSTIGSRGDIQPLVAIALALGNLDQEIRLCVPPDFCDWFESLGMPVTPIGPKLRSTEKINPSAVPPTPEQQRSKKTLLKCLQMRCAEFVIDKTIDKSMKLKELTRVESVEVRVGSCSSF